MADRQAPPEPEAHHFRRDRLGFRRVVAVRADPDGGARVTFRDRAREQTVPLAEWEAWVEPHGATPDRFVTMCAVPRRA